MQIWVLKLICMEYTNQEIADKLFVSKRTVEGHRKRLLAKTGALSPKKRALKKLLERPVARVV